MRAASSSPEGFIRSHLRLEDAPGLKGVKLYCAHKGSRLSLLGGDAPPYWAYSWAGGLALARHFIAHPNMVRTKRLLDLGAGSGLVGIVAAKLGARVSASEVDPYGRAAIALNAQANGVEITLLADLTAPPSGIDVIAAGDVFYDETVAASMLPLLQGCAAAGIAVLVGDPGRRDLPLDALEPIASYEVGGMGSSGAGKARVYRLR
ncbi:MAG: hypothetical protein ABS76_26985 [Pelagibacterium sp. SCN 64-44]|nr:MAG: hypothetical protein ABS76_26985 [Pelagibacterium sp. SCN 64-44]